MDNAFSLANECAIKFKAEKYLALGVTIAEDFSQVRLPLKVAVTPDSFAVLNGPYADENRLVMTPSSNDFFQLFPDQPWASLFVESDGRPTFDIIHIFGGRPFAQSLNDFTNSLAFCHTNTIWIISNTVPMDVFDTLPERGQGDTFRRYAGLAPAEMWNGDTFKTIFSIHDIYPEFSYCTAMLDNSAVTILWQAPPLSSRKPRFRSKDDIAKLTYIDIFIHADLFLPVVKRTALVLIGGSLEPPLYGSKTTWEKLVYTKIKSTNEENLSNKLEAWEKKIENLEFRLTKAEEDFVCAETLLRQEIAALKLQIAANNKVLRNPHMAEENCT